MLVRSVGVEELAGNIYYLVAVPVHNESRFLSDLSHLNTLKILFSCEPHEFVSVRCGNDTCHSFLRFGDGKLSTVESVIFLRDCIKVYLKAISQLADSNTYTACTEVIALLDQTCSISVPEQSLYLTFFRSITLLYLGAACLDRMRVMCLG